MSMTPDNDGLPSDAELDALQAEINKAKDGISARAEKEAQEAIKAAVEKEMAEQGINTEEPDAGAAAIARINELEMELATLKDQALRALADAQNTKKRAEREVAAARVFGIERFANDILPVHDNLSRALATLDEKARADLGEAGKSLLTGIEMTEKDLMAALARHGVKAVPGVGSKFDPNVHQAVAQIPSEEEKGNVATVMQNGFKIGERTLRAAMVAVSTGPAG